MNGVNYPLFDSSIKKEGDLKENSAIGGVRIVPANPIIKNMPAFPKVNQDNINQSTTERQPQNLDDKFMSFLQTTSIFNFIII